MKKKIALLASVLLVLTGCGSSGTSSASACTEIQPIALDLANVLQSLVTDFSSDYNDQLASSLSDLRGLSDSDPAVAEAIDSLEQSIEALMSDLVGGDIYAASDDVNDMTVAVQSLTAACGL